MNTDRDNFHDWAREKPDNTSFGPASRPAPVRDPRREAICWGRLAILGLLGVALVVGFKWLAGL